MIVGFADLAWICVGLVLFLLNLASLTFYGDAFFWGAFVQYGGFVY